MATEAIVRTMETFLLKPYILVKVYILLGFANDPLLMASLATGTQCRLCAILNLKPDCLQDFMNSDNKSNNASTDISSSEHIPLVTRIKAVAKTSNLVDPIRQIALVDVLYENTIADSSDEVLVDTKQSKKAKGKDVTKVLPYNSMAKAVASSLNCLVPNVVVFRHISDVVQSIKIPIAMPSQVHKIKYACLHKILRALSRVTIFICPSNLSLRFKFMFAMRKYTDELK
jgi:hypothetical protein